MSELTKSQAMDLAVELGVARIRIFHLPSAQGTFGVKEPPQAALRAFNALFAELVNYLPTIDEYVPGEGCPQCGERDDFLVYEPDAGNSLLCNNCGYVLDHGPDRIVHRPGTEPSLVPVRGFYLEPDQLMEKVKRYCAGLCPECGVEQGACPPV